MWPCKTDDGEVRPLKNNRIKELLQVLQESDGKVIIWAVYRHDIQTIEKEIANEYGKETVASYYGDTKDDIRQSIVDSFMDSDSDLRFFVGNPKTGGYGLTLTCSHTVVYYSNDYSLEVRMQSEDRAHRIGQEDKVTYIDLIAEGTIDEKIVKALNNKIDLASQSYGRRSQENFIRLMLVPTIFRVVLLVLLSLVCLALLPFLIAVALILEPTVSGKPYRRTYLRTRELYRTKRRF